MKSFLHFLPAAILTITILPSPVKAGGDKGPPASVSFHIEGAPAEAPRISREVTTSAGNGFFRIIPEISNNDIASFSPFPASEDQTYGAMFVLKKQAARKLEVVTTSNQSKLLLSIVNGTPHEVVTIDKPVRDGKIVIWRGLQLNDIKRFDLLVPRINEDPAKWKKRIKELKKEMKEAAKIKKSIEKAEGKVR